jgi:SET domain-containing protein
MTGAKPSTKIVVRANDKGRGLYARASFRKGELVTRDHALVFPDGDGGPTIHRYTFEWNEPFVSALALGPGSLMNHSVTPNVVARGDFAGRRLTFRTLRAVKRGEELLINYNGEPDDATPITFEP